MRAGSLSQSVERASASEFVARRALHVGLCPRSVRVQLPSSLPSSPTPPSPSSVHRLVVPLTEHRRVASVFPVRRVVPSGDAARSPVLCPFRSVVYRPLAPPRPRVCRHSIPVVVLRLAPSTLLSVTHINFPDCLLRKGRSKNVPNAVSVN
uniref:Uncharacterized protein n=1 Tax=Plectus sambesii TaxID=2011161 RepID=A0A914W8Q3_9BILA